jgi:WXG100 family type VII secretion target
MAASSINSISVHHQAMQDSVDYVKKSHDILLTEHNDLYTFLQNLRGDWQGRGGTSWKDAQNEWDGSFTWILDTLQGLSVALGSIHDNYLSTDIALANQWGG